MLCITDKQLLCDYLHKKAHKKNHTPQFHLLLVLYLNVIRINYFILKY